MKDHLIGIYLLLYPFVFISIVYFFIMKFYIFRNHSIKHDTREIATRFIGVAPVANRGKEKWMYACILQSINKMRMMDLLQGTTDETQCPYDFQLLDQKTPGAAKVNFHLICIDIHFI